MFKDALLKKIEPYTKKLMEKAAPVLKKEAKIQLTNSTTNLLKQGIKLGSIALTVYALSGAVTKKTHTPQIIKPEDIPNLVIHYTDSHNTYNYYKEMD